MIRSLAFAFAFAGLIAMPFADARAGAKPLIVQIFLSMDTKINSLAANLDSPSKRDKNVGIVGYLIQQAKRAKKYDPLVTWSLPKERRPKFLENYRAAMDDLIKVLGLLRAAVKRGDVKRAEEHLATIHKMRIRAHKIYTDSVDEEGNIRKGEEK